MFDGNGICKFTKERCSFQRNESYTAKCTSWCRGVDSDAFHAVEQDHDNFCRKLCEEYPELVQEATNMYKNNDIDDANDDIDDENPIFSPPKSKNSVFELNLAEFPIVMLSTKSINLREYQYSDTIKGRNDELVKRTWTIKIEGTNESGKPLHFPGPAALQVIFELFQLWNQQKFRDSRIIVGTYHQFLKRLGWGARKDDYDRLKYVLDCIHALHISCKNAFYIKAEDTYINQKMYLFPSMGTLHKDEIPIDDPNARLYIRASPELYTIMKKNNKHYMPITREHFRELTPMEQKLSMILSKYFSIYRKKQRISWNRKISELAQQLPIISKDNKKIRQQLKKICEGLIEKQSPLLSKYEIKNNTITFFNNIQTYLQFDEDKNAKKEPQRDSARDYLFIDFMLEEQIKHISGDNRNKPFFILVAKYVPEEIILRCISTAKQEAKDKIKLYTYMILHEAEKYIRPYLKNADTIYLKSNGNFSDNDIEEINKKSKPVELEYYVEKDKSENPNKKDEIKDSIDTSLQLEIEFEKDIIADTPAPKNTISKDDITQKKQTFFDNLPKEEQKQIITFMKNKHPRLFGNHSDDSRPLITAILNHCITNDLKIIQQDE